MITFKVDIDKFDMESKLGEHLKKKTTIARRMMGKVASEIKKETKATKLRGQVLHKVSGFLAKSMFFKTFKDYTAIVGDRAYYASWHELGLGDRLSKREFLLPVVNDYFNSSKAEDLMDDILQDALEKIYNKDK